MSQDSTDKRKLYDAERDEYLRKLAERNQRCARPGAGPKPAEGKESQGKQPLDKLSTAKPEAEKHQVDKQKISETEKERYLRKMSEQSQRRQTGQELRQEAESLRAEHAERTRETYLDEMTRRSEFRNEVQERMVEDKKQHEEAWQKMGQVYRERFAWVSSKLDRQNQDKTTPPSPSHKPDQSEPETQP